MKKSKKNTSKSVVKRVWYKTFGEGTVMEIKNGFIIVNLDEAGRKQLNYKLCLDKGTIKLV